MKIVELTNHIQLPVTNEEADLLSKFHHDQVLLKSELDIREQVVASNLVNKGALIRKNNNGKIEFRRYLNH